jgi:hypothetical protein
LKKCIYSVINVGKLAFISWIIIFSQCIEEGCSDESYESEYEDNANISSSYEVDTECYGYYDEQGSEIGL